MLKNIFLVLVIAAAAVIVVSFFMPWAQLSTSVTKISDQITGKFTGAVQKLPIAGGVIGEVDKGVVGVLGAVEGDIKLRPVTVSGFDIPKMANKKVSKISLSLMQVLFTDFEDMDKKSFLVYLVPLLGIICVILAVMGSRYKLAVLAMLVLSGAAGIAAIYNIMTADLSDLPVNIEIGDGIWFVIFAYFFISFIGILWLVAERKRRNS